MLSKSAKANDLFVTISTVVSGVGSRVLFTPLPLGSRAMKRPILSGSVAASIATLAALLPSAALAQSSASASGLVAEAPAPSNATLRTDRLHDGFYLRVNLGLGTQWTTLDDAVLRPNFSAKASSVVADVLVGGAPSPGIVLGGALLLDSLPSTEFNAAGRSAKTGLSLATLGPFIDGYPNPRGGFHSGGMLGVSAAHLTGNTYFAADRAYGFGLATWLGYDCWVAEQWSMGALLRFAGAHVVDHGGASDVGVYTRSIALLFTTVYQ